MATLTLKNVPEELYAELKRRAVANRRSLNQETIVSLEQATAPEVMSEAELMAEIDAFQDSMAARGRSVDPAEVERSIKEGRR